MFSKWWHYAVALVLGLGIVSTALAGLAAALIYPNLPPLEALTDYKPKQPLRIYSSDGALLGEFGEERRAFVPIAKVPQRMKQAIIAAEDERFYQHGGVDTLGILRAAVANLVSGGAKEGASTITMQVARNFFLSREKTLTRKMSEVLLAIKIEHNLSKDKILELYINQIYLGQRAYGFEAAARTYFGKPLDKLSLAETAMLAGLPKGPSLYNPVINPQRAQARQHYVLGRMKSLHMIADAEYRQALEQKLVVRKEKQIVDVPSDYVAEMVRQTLFQQYGESLYSTGFKAYTTIRKDQQAAANQALQNGLVNYDQRHSYRGPEKHLDLPSDEAGRDRFIADALGELDTVNGLEPAVVLQISPKSLVVGLSNGKQLEVLPAGFKLAADWLPGKKARKAHQLVQGDVVRVVRDKDGKWRLTQIPEAEAALVALDTATGGITALVGGFDYARNKFNHATQAWRQPGSSFKPFIYSAALEKGYTPATIIDDAPVTLSAEEAGGTAWEPKNFDNQYSGPVRMRTALTRSLNMVSIRILQGIGPYYARDYIKRFGFDPARHPPYLTMALGAGSVTPLQLASGYAVFANGGYAVKPYLIERVVDGQGLVVMQSKPYRPGIEAPRVLDARNAFIMTNMMQDVVRYGTAARASQLGRSDIAGKTGTTNEQRDGWFAGFNPSLVAVAWIGFDQPRSLGPGETGAQAALPIWMEFMAKALRNQPQRPFTMPAGVITAQISAETGAPVAEGEAGGITEYFYQEYAPSQGLSIPDASGHNPLVPDLI
ncbi:MAG TPA: penicillin-binding protein 1A [Thiobacillaceae bacterium]|nr:penicillin-binding protein 1A [Thiobacillaceae bacterium]